MAERPLPFTLDEFKAEMLTGIPLTFTDRNGTEVTYPDSAIRRRIVAAVNKFERELQMDLWPRRVITRAHALYPDLVQGQDYDIDEDPLDYSARDFFAQGYVKLLRWPIRSVEKMEFRFPENTVLHNFPSDWLRIYHQTGQIYTIAIAGSTQPIIIGREGGFLPLLTASLQRSGVPQLVYVQYHSGIDWTNPDAAAMGHPSGPDIYEDIKLALLQQAAVPVLFDLSRGIAPGVGSESLSEDGQSESVSYARGKGGIYGQEIEGLKGEVAEFLAGFKRFRKGIRFSVL
jgi:hypothetical protein